MNKHAKRLKEIRREERKIQSEASKRHEVIKEGINYAIGVLMPLTFHVLRYKYGFGEKRLSRFLEEFQVMLDNLKDGKISYNALIEDVLYGTTMEYNENTMEWYFGKVKNNEKEN